MNTRSLPPAASPRSRHALLGVAALLACGTAAADSLTLSYQEQGPASLTVSTGTVSSPTSSSVIYGDTFSAPTSALTNAPTYGFYDDYVFTIAAGQVDTTATTISLGPTSEIDNLQVRLYSLASAGSNPLPLVGINPTGVMEGWTSSINFSPTQTLTSSWISPTTLTAGTYVLEVRGSVVGTSGGGYSGVLNLTPVPLPAGLPLLLSGLGGLAGLVRRRARA
ncbi:MAG: FxDxF family PEP-CTERM protein [Proteobacteria bacterium]|nr:FxDxF family PEP-CTERM protein [Pseudomonadota bacterium]